MEIETYSQEESMDFAKKMAEKLEAGSIVCLDGDLGVGKTVFAKGFALGLGITEPITSPTFTIVQIYEEGKMPLYHFDVYRISDIDEMDEIGYEDYFFGSGVSLVEWSNLIVELIPDNAIYVEIIKDPEKGFDYRKIVVRGWNNEDIRN